MATLGVPYRCPSCLHWALDRFECCGRALTVPSLAPVLPDLTWGHVVQGRAHHREVASRLLERVCNGHSPLPPADAAGLFSACRTAPGHLAWLWQSDLDTLLGAGTKPNALAHFALSQSFGLILELTALPRGGVEELELLFERLAVRIAQIKSDEDPPLSLLAVVCDDVMRRGDEQFRLEKYCRALCPEFLTLRDVPSALALLLQRGPAPRTFVRRPASSTHVRVFELGGTLGRELLCQLHTTTRNGAPRAPFVANGKDVHGVRWRRFAGASPPPVTPGSNIPIWTGFRVAFARNQSVVVELVDREWLLNDDAAPLIVCVGARTPSSEIALHFLLLRMARFGLGPTVIVTSEESAPELVQWCQERFAAAARVRWASGGAASALNAALREVPWPPLIEVPAAPSWLSRWWPLKRRRQLA